MGLKISISVIPCPSCGAPIVAHDYASTGLYVAKCPDCKKELEIRKDLDGKDIIKPKRIN